MAVEIDYRRSSKTPHLNYPDVAQFGRAPALGAGCRRFESCSGSHINNKGFVAVKIEAGATACSVIL